MSLVASRREVLDPAWDRIPGGAASACDHAGIAAAAAALLLALRPQKGSKSVTHLTSLAGMDAVVEATGLVTTDTTEDGGSVKFCAKSREQEERRRQVVRKGRSVGQRETSGASRRRQTKQVSGAARERESKRAGKQGRQASRVGRQTGTRQVVSHSTPAALAATDTVRSKSEGAR